MFFSVHFSIGSCAWNIYSIRIHTSSVYLLGYLQPQILFRTTLLLSFCCLLKSFINWDTRTVLFIKYFFFFIISRIFFHVQFDQWYAGLMSKLYSIKNKKNVIMAECCYGNVIRNSAANTVITVSNWWWLFKAEVNLSKQETKIIKLFFWINAFCYFCI